MGWTDILGTIMKLGGTAANMMGQPEFGVPLSVGGGMAGGAKGGVTGALTEGAKSAVGQGLSMGMGAGLDALRTPSDVTSGALISGDKLSAPLSSAVKDPSIMNSLGGNLAVSDPAKQLSTPYANMSGMDVMNAMGKNKGLFGGS